MALSAFADKNSAPTQRELEAVLGRAYGAWTRLLASLAERIDPISELWGYTGASFGWGLRVRHNDRVILYMTPQQGRFLVSFALGEKAVAAAAAARLHATLREAIAAAPRYAEGRGVRITVTNARLVPALTTLAEIKDHH